MNMNKISLFFLFFLGCFTLSSAFALKIPPEPYYCKLIDRITYKYIKEYMVPQGFSCIGYGGGMMFDIEKVGLSFIIYKTVTVDEARILYINMIEEYLHRVNCNEEIRPYLHNYPFTVKNLKFDIEFDNINGNRVTDKEHVSFVCFAENRNLIFYDSYDYNTDKFIPLYNESYEDALKIVKESSKIKIDFQCS